MVGKIVGVDDGRIGLGVPEGVADAVIPIVEDGTGIIALLLSSFVQLTKRKTIGSHKIIVFFKLDIVSSLWL
jgi:hypothetical protein